MTSRRTRLPQDVQDLLRRGRGLLALDRARSAGVHPDRLSRLVHAGHLVRMARGVYASADSVGMLDGWGRHELMARAFARSCGPDAYLTEWSAVPVWKLPTSHRPPRLPTVVRPKRPGQGTTRTPYGRTLVANLPEDHRWRTGDVGVVSQGWAAASIALTAPVADALIIADAALRNGADLHDAIRHMRRWKGAGRARWVADNADPRAETPIETLGRFTCIEFCLPMPVSNAWVGMGGPEFRVDGLWPFHWAVHEADGAVKYDNRPDASKIVTKQNEREWRLRRIGLDLVRYGWKLAAHQRPELAARFAALLRDNPARSEPIRWWKDVPGQQPVEPAPGDWPSPEPSSIVLPAGWRHGLGRR